MQELLPLLQEMSTSIQVTPKDTVNFFMKLKRQYSKKHGLAQVPTNTELLAAYRMFLQQGQLERQPLLEQYMRKRSIRSQSGIVSIQVLTKPFRCPGECIFCPNDASMPKSYINTEPGAMRALLNQFDPYKQVYNRLLSLYLTGHNVEKIEMIVLGGTWDVYPVAYKESFLKGLYDACNTFDQFLKVMPIDDQQRAIRYDIATLGIAYPETIKESIAINETAPNRMIGLTVETRPEYVTDENCRLRRERGVTRLEIGLQSMFDDVLDANKRGHSVQQARLAFHKLRQYGFKFSVHFMPGLYMSTLEKDSQTFALAYADPYIKPDEIKFYPTSVIPNTVLYELYKKGDYKPLETEEIASLIKTVQHDIIPPYTRIKRLIRDIPATEIVSGSNVTNLRQLTEREEITRCKTDVAYRKELYDRLYPSATYFETFAELLTTLDENRPSDENTLTYVVGQKSDTSLVRSYIALDTRSREMRHRIEGKPMCMNLIVRKYNSSAGLEYFVSMEDDLGYIYGFVRLLIPEVEHTIEREGLGKNTALVRELHVYGQVASLNPQTYTDATAQHQGYGSQLMYAAEQLAIHHGFSRVSVISGIGVREYYKKLGYGLDGTYMVKNVAE